MARWLNRKEFLKFRVLPEESTDDPCYFNASFNLQKIKHRERICGITLTMETDAPFGYGEDKNISLDFTADGSQTVHDTSDEIGETAVDITLTCGEDGSLTLTNETLGAVTEIKNCKAGEKITILGQQQIILSDSSSHDIANDFNYAFPKIGNTYDNRDNVLTASAACHIDLHYCPIIKSTP